MSCCSGPSGPTVLEQLQSTPLYAYLDDAELGIVADAFVRQTVNAGSLLPPSPFYMLLTGEVEVNLNGKQLCRKVGGSFFSRAAGRITPSRRSTASFAPIPKGYPYSGRRSIVGRRVSALAAGSKRLSIMGNRDRVRRTSAPSMDDDDEVASEFRVVHKAELLLLMPERLAELKEIRPEMANVIQTTSHTNLETYLGKVPFIRRAGLQPEQLRMLGELGSYITKDGSTTLFSQGEVADAFYVLLHGKLEVWVDRSGDGAKGDANNTEEFEMQRASVLGPGDHIGESALVVEAKRSATIKVVERSIFFCLHSSHFGAFLKVAPELERGILLHTKERLMQVYRQLRIPFFAELTDVRIAEAAKQSLLQHYNKGDVVCTAGDEGKAFYVVVAGGVDIVPEEVFHKAPGSYFGEITMLLQEQKVTATCTCPERTTLLVLPREGFGKLFVDEPELAAYMRIKILRFHCTLHDVLTHHKSKGLLKAFLKSEYADESLDFYDAVIEYKALGEAERATAGTKLVDMYLPDGAARQINIPSACQQEVIRTNKEGALTVTSFDAAQKEVYTLMAKDSLARFVQTKEFESLLSSFGSYDIEKVVSVSSGAIELDLELMAA